MADEETVGERVRVVVRVRPLLSNEVDAEYRDCVKVFDNQVILGGERTFAFDAVYDQRATSERVFHDVCAPLLESFFNGYNCTIFAYGQTGAGKTYTMNFIV